jgi:hypothetical protein
MLTAAQVLGQKVYEATQTEVSGGDDDEVVEAEIVDEGEDA